MFTPAAPVGAVLIAGSLIYEYRDELGQAAGGCVTGPGTWSERWVTGWVTWPKGWGTPPKGWATSLASEQTGTRAHSEEADPAAGDASFEERRGFTPSSIGLLVAVAVGLGWGFAGSYGLGLDARTGLSVLGGAAFLGALTAVLARTPGTSDCKSIHVDRDGLTVGRQFLPAGEVGQVTLLPEAEASRAARSCRHQDTRIGRRRMSYNYLPNSGPAVFVVQKGRDLRGPGWLIASRDPEGLLAALTELRAAWPDRCGETA
jgi:hypothetical protein